METKLLQPAIPAFLPTFDAFITEGQNSRLVPSPTKLAVAGSSELFWPSLYGNPPISPDYKNKDTFLGQYIHKIYCRECRDKENMASGQPMSASASSTNGSQPNSPPQYAMDQMSLTAAMDANKEGEFCSSLSHTHAHSLESLSLISIVRSELISRILSQLNPLCVTLIISMTLCLLLLLYYSWPTQQSDTTVLPDTHV